MVNLLIMTRLCLDLHGVTKKALLPSGSLLWSVHHHGSVLVSGPRVNFWIWIEPHLWNKPLAIILPVALQRDDGLPSGYQRCNIRYLLKTVKTRNCRKMSKKSPKMPFGTSWQPPRKMSKKCMESVLVLGLALENCPENFKKVSPRHF